MKIPRTAGESTIAVVPITIVDDMNDETYADEYFSLNVDHIRLDLSVEARTGGTELVIKINDDGKCHDPDLYFIII